jgi:hypothetical protein
MIAGNLASLGGSLDLSIDVGGWAVTFQGTAVVPKNSMTGPFSFAIKYKLLNESILATIE